MENSDDYYLDLFIKNALQEDLGDGDHTSLATIKNGEQGRSQLLVKESGVLAGVRVATRVFQLVDQSLHAEWLRSDGDEVSQGDVVLYLDGEVHSILAAERLVLNIMQRMSGIATYTRRIAQRIASTHTKLLDTRKTTPGMRFLEKEAVSIGGGVNHRFGLFDMILIKDNHVDYAGGIVPALAAANNYLKEKHKNLEIEIEVRDLDELAEVLSYGHVDRIMLDNFEIGTLAEAVRRVQGRYKTEASGGITEETIVDVAHTGVDYISMGALTHSVKSLDLSLKALVVQ